VALILIILALFSFGIFGFGSGSSSIGSGSTQSAQPKYHLNCKARMSSGQSRRNACGGPPANP
jgi:hypothetical protein